MFNETNITSAGMLSFCDNLYKWIGTENEQKPPQYDDQKNKVVQYDQLNLDLQELISKLIKDIPIKKKLSEFKKLFSKHILDIDHLIYTQKKEDIVNLIESLLSNKEDQLLLLEYYLHGVFSLSIVRNIALQPGEKEGATSKMKRIFFIDRILSPATDIPAHDLKHLFRQPRSLSVLSQITGLLLSSYEKKGDIVINTLLSYVNNENLLDNLLRYYSRGDEEGIRSLTDLWLRKMVDFGESLNILLNDSTELSENTSTRTTSETDLTLSYLQIYRLLEHLTQEGSDDMRKLLRLKRLDEYSASGDELSSFDEDELKVLSFKEFDIILKKIFPAFYEDLTNGKVKNVKRSSHDKRARGETTSTEKKTCAGYLEYLCTHSHNSLHAFEGIRDEINRMLGNEEAQYLESLFLYGLDNFDSVYDPNYMNFYRGFLRLCPQFKKNCERPVISNHYLEFAELNDALLENILRIITYRDLSFKKPLFHDERDEYLSMKTFRELFLILSHFFKKPRVIKDNCLYKIAYWLTDIIDKKILGEDEELYRSISSIVITGFWYKSYKDTPLDYGDVIEINGLGYSLVLTGEQLNLNIGYNIIFRARELYFNSLTNTSKEDMMHTRALIYSNLATYFVKIPRHLDSPSEKELALRLAREYDSLALSLRVELDERFKDDYRSFIALSHSNLGTSHYYSGWHFEEIGDMGVARNHYMDSIKHQIESLSLYVSLEDKSDHLLRTLKKIKGSIESYKRTNLQYPSFDSKTYNLIYMSLKRLMDKQNALPIEFRNAIKDLREITDSFLIISPGTQAD